MAFRARYTKKPDGKHPDRIWLAEIVKPDGGVQDAAYFPTKTAAQQWAANAYRI